MKDNFDSVMTFVFKSEGGYVNNPRDPGGPTNFGITIATLSHELGRAATTDEVKYMSRDTALAIYRKKYWNLIGGDTLPRGVDLMEMDICVNSGVGRVAPWARTVCTMSVADQIDALDRARRSFWKSLKTWAVFGKGWSRREDACVALARIMAGVK